MKCLLFISCRFGKKGQHLEKISSPSFALSRRHCGRSNRGLWRSAAFSRSSAASALPGGETEAAAAAADREMLRMLDSPTDYSLKKDNRASSPAPKSKWRGVLIRLQSVYSCFHRREMRAGSDLTAILNPLADLGGPASCILNSAHTVAMATTDHLWLWVHLSANTPSCTHSHALLFILLHDCVFCVDEEILSTCTVKKEAVKSEGRWFQQGKSHACGCLLFLNFTPQSRRACRTLRWQRKIKKPLRLFLSN